MGPLTNLGDSNDIAGGIFEYNQITRNRFSIVHVCQGGLVKSIDPVHQLFAQSPRGV